MKLTIKNFRGIVAATLDVKPITLIAGENGAGKTSIVQALAAAMTGEVLPIDGLTKKTSGFLCHNGATESSITVETDDGSATVEYPAGKRSTTGFPPETDTHSAGVLHLLDMDKKTRALAIADILKAEPTAEELQAELTKIDTLGDETKKRLLNTMKAQGWDAAHALAKEAGTKAKGQWEQITAERYGAKKAAEWLPAAWDSDLETAHEPHLAEEMERETEWLDQAKAAEQIAVSDTAKLTEAAGELDERQSVVDNLTVKQKSLIAAVEETKKAMAALPSPEQPEPTHCPHCKGSLLIEAGAILPFKKFSPGEITKRQKAIESAQESLDALRTDIEKNNELIVSARADLRASQNAAAELKTVKPAAKGEFKRSVADCVQRVETAKSRLLAYQKKTQADAAQLRVSVSDTVAALLAPDGMRMVALHKALEELQSRCNDFAAVAGWGKVEMSKTLAVYYGGRPYMLCSESEQWRTRAVLQAAVAQIRKAPVVLMDRADLLDKAGRNGLVRLALALEIPVVIAMTISGGEGVPNMSKAGGVTYWISEATATELVQ